MSKIEHEQIIITVDTYPLAGQRTFSPELLIPAVEKFMREQGVTYELRLETRRMRAVEER